MNLKNVWKVISDNNLELKLFSNVENPNELLIRDKNDTRALCSFIIFETGIKVQEMSWAISLNFDWKNKTILLADSEEKKEL